MNDWDTAAGPSSPEVVEMAVCESCGTMVPAANLPLHEARACPNRKSPPRRMNGNRGGRETSSASSGRTMERRENAAVPMNPTQVATAADSTHIPGLATTPLVIHDTDDNFTYGSSTNMTPPMIEQSVTVIRDDVPSPSSSPPSTGVAQSCPPMLVDGFEVDGHPPTGVEQVSAVDNDSPWRRLTSGLSNVFCQGISPAPAVPSYPGARRLRDDAATACGGSERQHTIDLTEERRSHRESVEAAAQWPCPRCTLLNHSSRSTCEACSYRKHEQWRRNPRQRHVPYEDQVDSRYARSEAWYGPLPSISGRAREQPSLRSTQNVAVGGAIFGGVMGAASALARGRPVMVAAVDGALNGAVGSIFLNNMVQHVEESRSPDNRHVVDINEHDTIQQSRAVSERMWLLDELVGLHAMEEEIYRGRLRSSVDPRSGRRIISIGGIRRQPEMDVSQMSYEELLARFGDGSENRGASTAQLNELPVQIIDDASKLTGDNKKCLICLEEFRVGDKRKMLPCLHSYHEFCANTWLKTNASCPVCKHRLGE